MYTLYTPFIHPLYALIQPINQVHAALLNRAKNSARMRAEWGQEKRDPGGGNKTYLSLSWLDPKVDARTRLHTCAADFKCDP